MPATASRPVTADFVIGKLNGLRMKELPLLLREVGLDVVRLVVAQGQGEIAGGSMADNDPNRKLATYYATALRGSMTVSEGAISVGLPASDLNARILAFRNEGGTITMKEKMLRIPLAPALTGAGWDRYLNVDLKSKIGTKDNPFHLAVRGGQAFLALTKGTGKRKTEEFWYVLKPSVTVRPHPWMDRTVEWTESQMPDLIARGLDRLEKRMQR